jgi:hypothetical protein
MKKPYPDVLTGNAHLTAALFSCYSLQCKVLLKSTLNPPAAWQKIQAPSHRFPSMWVMATTMISANWNSLLPKSAIVTV